MLYDVTLLNLTHVVYSYPSTIKDLMLHEQGRVMLGEKGPPSDFRSMPLDVRSGRHIQ